MISTNLDLEGEYARLWGTFVSELRRTHIWLSDHNDELIWG
jgi:hypothetical protein